MAAKIQNYNEGITRDATTTSTWTTTRMAAAGVRRRPRRRSEIPAIYPFWIATTRSDVTKSGATAMTTPSPLVEKRQLRKFNTLGDPLFSRAGSLFKRERSSRALSPASPSPSPAPLASPLPQAEVRNPLLVIESLQAQLQVAEASVLRTRDDVARERDFSAKELEQARGDAKRSLWVGTAVCLCMLVLEAAAPDFAELRVGVAAITLAGLVAMSTRYALHSKPQRNTCVCGKWAEEEQQRCADCGLLSTGFKDKYALMGMLGRGSYSTVRVGVDKQANKDVAVKVVAKPGADSERLVVEVRALQALRHPRVIRFIDWYEDGKTFYIVTELAAGGELFGRIVERVRWSERDARQVVMTLAETMLFMHERGYVHRDIKPENILLRNKNDDSSLLLADFGFVAKVKKRGLTDACGTPLYVAPEIVSGCVFAC